ncbi:MAG: efflux RND transporter permease subunit [Bacteroidales bacterium]|nr:efflux RND transporter permease subunit [Bacteroidales bacterium]
MSIYRKAVNNPVTTALVFIAFAVFGIFSLANLSINNFPEFDSNYIMVMSSYNGASAEDVENNLAKVLENTLNGVSDLKNITSTSKENVCVIALEFEYGIDIDVATNDVRDKLDLINSYLPDGASVPVIFKFSADDMPIMIMSATADQSLPGLEKILDDRLATPLARVSGVGTVSVNGAPKREIQVYCDPAKLEAYHLTVTGISTAIASENRNIPNGTIDIGSNTYTLRVEKEFDEPSEMLDIIVGYSGGRAIYLRDVATIRDTVQEKYQESYTNGVQGAQIIIQKQSGANTVNVIKKIKKAMTKIEKNLPSDIKVITVVDNSRNILNSINSLKETIIITFLVVMLVVFVFLGRWRATFIIVLAIPISLLASIIYLFATGNTLNIISMSALSIAIGMVVDDAIVVLENVTTHIERGEKPKEAAVHATGEVGISVIASTLTMLAVFLPLTMIKGMAGIMFRQLGWIVSIIMIVSTCGALTLVPMLCSKMLKKDINHGKIYNALFTPINKSLDAISVGYSRLINWAVRHRAVVMTLAVVIFAASLVVFGPGIKTEYMPKQDQGRLSVKIQLPVGTEQSITREFARRVYDRFVEEFPEIERMSYSFGQADTDNAFASMQSNGTHIISYHINIGSMEDRERSCAEIADIMRKELYEYTEIKKFQVTEGQGGMGGQSSVEVEIYGNDFAQADAVMADLAVKLKNEPCFSEAFVSRDEYTPEYQVDFDRTKLAVNGLNSTTAASYVTACINGSMMSYFREDGEEYDIRVRYAPEFRTSLEDVENIMIYNNMGTGVRIKDLGEVVESACPPDIVRKNRERMVKITAVMANGYALSDGVQAAERIIEQSEIPTEIECAIAGDYEDQQDMFKDLIVLLILIVIMVYMVMASQFESFMDPFVIMLSVPFAITGVLLATWIHNMALGAMALIGIIILMGIVVKNGIVLIDYTKLMRERGMGINESVVTAAKSRLRPILMTTLTTVLGMVPMAAGKGEGSEMWHSLGLTVAWGLTVSTLITLVVIPTFYAIMADAQLRSKNRKEATQARRAEKWAAKKAQE